MSITKINELRSLCRKLGLASGGTMVQLAERIERHQNGRPNRFGAGKIDCEICGMPAKVTGTKRNDMKDGRTLITRQIVCTGKHRHTYPLKEIL